MLIWKKCIVLAFTGLLLLLFYFYPPEHILSIFYKLEVIEEYASSSVVKDIRGKDPYVTIKMKCFYQDSMNYGDNWRKIMENTDCHGNLFKKCFRNRTHEGRQETHVLTFIRTEQTTRCTCRDDVIGWCKGECGKDIDVRCCLDKGKTPVLCRK